MTDKYILAGMLVAIVHNHTENGTLNCTDAAEELLEHGVRPTVPCKRCRNFVPTKGGKGWCNHCFGPRGFNDFCSHAERRR